jgi:hypothetical protein
MNTGDDIFEETLHYDGTAEAMHDWLAEEALHFVWRTLNPTNDEESA